MSNVLQMSAQSSIQNLAARGWSARRIARELLLNRRTVAKYFPEPASDSADPADPASDSAAASKCTTSGPLDLKVTIGSDAQFQPAPAPSSELCVPKCTTADPVTGKVTIGSNPHSTILPTPRAQPTTAPAQASSADSRSKCEPWREVILPLCELGLTAQRIHQDLCRDHGFTGAYESVKRYLTSLRATAPTLVHRVEARPGEEMQVDFGLGAPVLEPGGKQRRTWVFRAVLSYSRKGYSESVFHQDTETFLRVIENALRHFGGVPLILNLDNLKAAVLKAHWYDPELNPKLQAFCAHYQLNLLPCRPRTPQHKGKVERGIAYVKSNALAGLKFTSLSAQNIHLIQWEQNVADTRLHGTTRAQVQQAFALEKPHLQPLPSSLFACYQESLRRVGRDSHVQVKKAYYQVPLEYIGHDVWVHTELRSVRIFNQRHEHIASHLPLEPGRFSRVQGVGGFDPNGIGAHAAAQQWILLASRSGPHAAAWTQAVWQHRGIAGVRSLMALAGLRRNHSHQAIERACAQATDHSSHRLRDLQSILKAGAAAPIQAQLAFNTPTPKATLATNEATHETNQTPSTNIIRELTTYSQFIESQTTTTTTTPPNPAEEQKTEIPLTTNIY